MVRNLRELYQYRTLLWSLTVRELRARYRASVLGFFWTFLNPTLNMAVYTLVFGVIMQQSQRAYPYFLFVGLLPWTYFASSVGGGTSAVSDRRDLLTKVRFPAQVLPATVVATNLVNYLLSLPLMVGLGLVFGEVPSVHVLAFPLVVLVQTVFTLALTYLLAALNVRFRDLQHVVPNLLTMGFFLTPVVWKFSGFATLSERLPKLVEGLQVVLAANPMAVVIDAYRSVFYEHAWPQPAPLAWVLVVSLVLLAMASAVFERRREEFAELV